MTRMEESLAALREREVCGGTAWRAVCVTCGWYWGDYRSLERSLDDATLHRKVMGRWKVGWRTEEHITRVVSVEPGKEVRVPRTPRQGLALGAWRPGFSEEAKP